MHWSAGARGEARARDQEKGTAWQLRGEEGQIKVEKLGLVKKRLLADPTLALEAWS